MAVGYSSEVTIDRPPADVFPYLVDQDKQGLWSDVSMTRLTEGPLRTGSRFQVHFGMGPLKATVGIEMTEVQPGSLMTWRSFSGPIAWEGEYRLEPAPTGTRMSQRGTLVFHGLWRVMQPLVAGEIQSGEVKELEKLKSVVEAAS